MKSNRVVMAAGALAVAAGAAFGAVSFAQAAEPGRVQLADAEQMAAVKDRQELMKSIGGNMKTIADYLKESKGTEADVQAAAGKIAELSQKIPEAFKVEASLSEMDVVGKNRAKPEIWLMWDEFAEHAQTLHTKAEAVVAAANGGGMSDLQAAVGDMGKNGCGGCHDTFRGPKVE